MENNQYAAHLKRQMMLDSAFRLATRFFAFLVLAMLIGMPPGLQQTLGIRQPHLNP